MIKEHAAPAILDSVRRVPDTMIAVTTHCRSVIPLWVLGSITGKVVCHFGVLVLVIRASN